MSITLLARCGGGGGGCDRRTKRGGGTRPRGATPSPRSGAEAGRTPCPKGGGQEELPHVRGQRQRPRVPGCDSVGTAEKSYPNPRSGAAARRSYPTSEVRGRSREDLMPEGQRPRGVTPRPRSWAAAESARLQQRRNGGEELPKSEVRGGGQEELPHI